MAASAAMKDPRLVEIEFLMDVERNGMSSIRASLQDQSSGMVLRNPGEPEERLERYGFDAGRFRDMVIDQLVKAHVTSMSLRNTGGLVDERVLQEERQVLIRKLVQLQPVEVVISHAGRVHLWTLRDALLRNSNLEPFGLRDRTSWDRDLAVRLQWAAPDAPLSIIFLDLDNFGAVNKTYGVHAGDAVLKVTFASINNIVGTRGVAYRYGGEEVGVLLPSISFDEASKLAEEVRVAIDVDVRSSVKRIADVDLAGPQTASIGVGTFLGRIEPKRAVEHVDELQRRAKTGGKNRVEGAPFDG
jgi:diguanylate cyclase (GGDEF)-like protein